MAKSVHKMPTRKVEVHHYTHTTKKKAAKPSGRKRKPTRRSRA